MENRLHLTSVASISHHHTIIPSPSTYAIKEFLSSDLPQVTLVVLDLEENL
jgi:hypothetical protein